MDENITTLMLEIARQHGIKDHRVCTSDYEFGVSETGDVVGYIHEDYYPQIIIKPDLRVVRLTQPKQNMHTVKIFSNLYLGCIALAEQLYGDSNE